MDDVVCDSDDNNLEKPIINLIQSAYIKGKKLNKCEDSYFISQRAFGISDGVGGWSEFGFSSD